jgi:glycosyltransferase involved in cell wall biosynthesis
MPGGLVDQSIQKVGTALLTASGRLATVVCPLNAAYAENSVFLQRFSGKLVPILPPVDIPTANPETAARWREELGLREKRVVGIVGRFVEEKGFDYLFRALPELLENDPDVRVVYAGEHDMVYEDFYSRCRPLIEPLSDFVTFTGLIRDRQRLADFYAMCDVLVLPSRTDSFAAVQVEAMLCGTPVVASDIPGARVPVRLTGMGLLVEPRSPGALATGIRKVVEDPARYTRPRDEIQDVFDPVESVDRYEALMTRLASPRT